MAFLFNRSKAKGSKELCQSAKSLLQRLHADERPQPRVDEELASTLGQMRMILQGTPETEVMPQQVHQLIEYLLAEDLLHLLATLIHRLPFESRKDVQTVFSNVFRFKVSQSDEPVALNTIVNNQPNVIVALCEGYNHRESALPCGAILKEALKHESVAAVILFDESVGDERAKGLANLDTTAPASGNGVFWKFFAWIDKSVFEVAADAFNTFREILTKHKRLTSRYLLTNYTSFFTNYTSSLLESESYVTTRQSIKLLGELLLERQNYHVMRRYIESPQNLKLCMTYLKDDRKMISYEAFHIFKIFVASPTKSEGVRKILVQNRDKLLRFLPGFLEGREEDVQFHDEKAYLIRQIELLPSTYTPSSGAGLDTTAASSNQATPQQARPQEGGPGAVRA